MYNNKKMHRFSLVKNSVEKNNLMRWTARKLGKLGQRKGARRVGVGGQPPCENKMKFFIESNKKTTKNVEILDLENC